MKTILILTVGGSHQPILTAIEQHQPFRLHFLCSADSGKFKGSYTQVYDRRPGRCRPGRRAL